MNRLSHAKSALLIAAASLVFVSQPALADTKDLGKLEQGSDKLEGLCGNRDGKNWSTPDGMNYGCSYPGGGGIMCDKETGCMETTREGGSSTDRLPGLLGLLGLLGLAGLVSRRRRAEPVR